MAAQVLKRGRAIVWLPPRSIGERQLVTAPVLLAMLPEAASGRTGAATHAAGAVEQPVAASGAASGVRCVRLSLDGLPALKQVTLVFDARDVNLLRVTVPPLPAARLRQAIPNLVEDLLLQDAQACAYAIGPRLDDDGTRLVAAIDRAWLELAVGAFERRGIGVQAAWPAQLALPLLAGRTALACLHDGLALRTGTCDGIGWSAGADAEARAETIATALAATAEPQATAISAAPAASSESAGAGADAGAPQTPISGTRRELVAFVEDATWQAPVLAAAARAGVGIEMRPLAFPVAAPVDLLSARAGTAARRWLADVDWRSWRLPAAAAMATGVVALAGINLHWVLLAHESERLGAAIEQRYRDAFPGTQMIVDPLLQMQRRIADLRASAGEAGPDDFVPLLARFSQTLGAQSIDAMAAVDFREGRLRVRFQPGFYEGRAARDALARSGRQHGLSVRFDADGESTAAIALLR